MNSRPPQIIIMRLFLLYVFQARGSEFNSSQRQVSNRYVILKFTQVYAYLCDTKLPSDRPATVLHNLNPHSIYLQCIREQLPVNFVISGYFNSF